MNKPAQKPKNPCFSSGPCAKRPGWSLGKLDISCAGRSHRSALGKQKLKEVIEKHRALLKIPADYRIGIVPASDTGAIEMALWSMLGARGVDVLVWEAFSLDWMKDITAHLKLDNATTHKAEYGALPDLSKVNFKNDVVFVWNGTTSGVRVPDGAWIPKDREGLTFCDATSAVFAYDMPWDRLDVTTWSWQKVLGGEGGHGMLVLSPRAVARLESHKPARALPKIFRMTKKDDAGNTKLNPDIFEGLTINTPSMLAVEDCLDALNWAASVGGLEGTMARTDANYRAIRDWCTKSNWAGFLAPDEKTRSKTSVCLSVTDPWFTALPLDRQEKIIGALCKTLEKENAGYDVKNYRDAPHGLRIWCGATVEASDVAALTHWLDWAYEQARAEAQQKAA